MITVNYLFSKNKKIGSYLIRKFTKNLSKLNFDNIPSHTALLVNNRWVHESTMSSGVRIISYSKWLKINTEVYKIYAWDITDYQQIKQKYKKIKKKKYDYFGALFVGWRILLKYLKLLPLPKTNRYNDPNKFFCCEVVGELLNIDYTIKTPVEIMESANKKYGNVNSN